MKLTHKVLWFSRAALAAIDRRALDDYHLPILTLMENAGRAVAEAAFRHLKLGKGALILCGPGHNGGDGLVAARHLANGGIHVEILLLEPRDKHAPALAAQLRTIEAMKLPVKTLSADHAELRDWIVESDPQDLVIDALFGTGLSRPVTGLARDVIHALNVSRRTVIAVDIPSGLDADTGAPLGDAVRAAETVSFCGLKLGFKTAALYTGKVSIADIGAPAELLQACACPAPA